MDTEQKSQDITTADVNGLTPVIRRAVEVGTSIIFLNQGWISHLSRIIDENGLLTGPLAELILHMKKENREAFQELVKIRARHGV